MIHGTTQTLRNTQFLLLRLSTFFCDLKKNIINTKLLLRIIEFKTSKNAPEVKIVESQAEIYISCTFQRSHSDGLLLPFD